MKIDTTSKESINRTFRKAHTLYEKLEHGMDQFLWPVFKRYIDEMGINFNMPEEWEVIENYEKIISVKITGYDGCRGCYDATSIIIPWKFFEDFDAALKEQRDEEFRIAEQKKKSSDMSAKAMREAQYMKLKAEFENETNT